MGIKIHQYPLDRLTFGDDDYYDIDYWNGSAYETAKIKGSVIKAGIAAGIISDNLFTADLNLLANRNHTTNDKELKFTINDTGNNTAGVWRISGNQIVGYLYNIATPTDLTTINQQSDAIILTADGGASPVVFGIDKEEISGSASNQSFLFDALNKITQIAGTNGNITIGDPTNNTNTFYKDDSTNLYGIILRGFGETTEIDATGANYSSLVGTSLVPKKYVDDAIANTPASNISNSNLSFSASYNADLNGNTWQVKNGSAIILEINSNDEIIIKDKLVFKELSLNPNYIGFCHNALSSAFDTSYALVQNNVGATAIGCASGQTITFDKNNTPMAVFTSNGEFVYGALTVIGNEDFCVRGDTRIQGTDNAELTSGFLVTDINDDITLDIRNNGQIGYGGIYRNLYAHTFRNPNNEANIASFDNDTVGTESFIIQQNGAFKSQQSGQDIFVSYRQSGQSYIKLYDAGVESIKLNKNGSFINSNILIGGTSMTPGARFEIQQASNNVSQQAFFANARTSTAGRLGSDTGFNADQKGLECYDTDINKKYFWNGTEWEKIKGNIESVSVASATTLTPDIDSSEMEIVSALSSGLTISAPTGTVYEGKELTFRIKDDGTARSLTWNAIFEDYTGSLPTTTIANKTVYIGCKYNAVNTKWDIVAVQNQP